MTGISATELQLLECFGVEPELLDPDAPWCYNEAIYRVSLDGISIVFVVEPACGDVYLIVEGGLLRIFELNALGVLDVLVLDETGRDIVEIRLTKRAWLKVQLRPTFEMTQRLEFRT